VCVDILPLFSAKGKTWYCDDAFTLRMMYLCGEPRTRYFRLDWAV